MSCSLPTHLQLQRRSSAVQVFGARVLANTVSSKGCKCWTISSWTNWQDEASKFGGLSERVRGGRTSRVEKRGGGKWL